MRNKITFRILLITTTLLSFTSLYAGSSEKDEYESQDKVAARWESGELSYYPDNGYGMFMLAGTQKVKINKNSSGIVTSIEIGFDKHDRWTYSNSDWVDGYGKNNFYCLYLTDDCIASYTMEKGVAVSINAFYGSKLGSKKKALDEINTYLEYSDIQIKNGKKAVANEIANHKNLHSIEGKDIKELKIEIIATNQKLDCGSTFEVGFIATTTEGNVIKSKNLGGEAYPNDFYITVNGAKKQTFKRDGTKESYDLYTANMYCEEYRNKTLEIKISASDNTKKVESKAFIVNCVPDPAIIAKKKAAEQEEKEYAEYLKKEEARRKAEAANPTVVKEPVKVEVPKYTGIKISHPKSYTTSGRLNIRNTLLNTNSELLVFGQASYTTDYPGKIQTYSEFDKSDDNWNVYNRVAGKNEIINDVSLIDNNTFIVASSNKLYHGTKTEESNLTINQSIDNKSEKGSPDYRDFCSVVNLGNGICAALSTNNTKMEYSHVTYRTSLFLHVWDFKNNKQVVFKISSENVNAMPRILKTSDNQIVIIYNELSGVTSNYEKDLFLVCYKTSKSILHKIDPLKTFTNNSISTIWKVYTNENVEITDVIEDRFKNIVYTFKSQEKYKDKKAIRNMYCEIGLARVNSKGENLESDSYDKLNIAYFSGQSYELHVGNTFYMNAWSRPHLIQAANNDGYLVLHQNAFMPGKKTGETDYVFLDQPILIYHNGNSLRHESADLLYTDHLGPKYYDDAAVSHKFGVKDIQYDKKSNQYLIIEQQVQINSSGPGNHNGVDQPTVWSVTVDLFSDFYRPEDKESSVASNTNSSSSTSSKTSSTTTTAPTKPTTFTIKNTGSSRLNVYADRGTVQINSGKSAEFKCHDKVYYCTMDSHGAWNVKGALINDSKTNCGDVIEIK